MHKDKYYDEIVEVTMPRKYAIKLKVILSRNPDADIEEVKHGHFVRNERNIPKMKEFHERGYALSMNPKSIFYTCSECGEWISLSQKYCSECGAKMDGTPKERGADNEDSKKNVDFDMFDFSKLSIDEKFWALVFFIFANCKDIEFIEKIKDKFNVDKDKFNVDNEKLRQERKNENEQSNNCWKINKGS